MRLVPILMAALAVPASAQASADWSASRQAVVVTTAGWEATSARVQRWERTAPGGAWRAVGEPMDAMVGRTGLGWGVGLHPAGGPGPVKREGDGRAPAGVYRLGTAFGYAAAGELPWIRLPYRQATAQSRCVDDGSSRWYNRWVEADQVTADWNSAEEMHRRDDRYRLGIWVDHNADPPVPGAGSCIFMHLWAAPGVATVGCTAFAPSDLEALLRWLDPAAAPVLIQLPEAEYARRRQEWTLP